MSITCKHYKFMKQMVKDHKKLKAFLEELAIQVYTLV